MDIQKEEFEKEIKEWYPLAECISKERNISICDLYPIEWSLWQASSIPEGYVVVPKEPTQEMIEAHMNSEVILAYVGAYEKAVESYKKQYKAMIEAVEKNDE